MTGSASPSAGRNVPATGAGGTLVVGLSHSGKTEARSLLETSPRMFATRRARHWTVPDRGWGSLEIGANLDSCVRSVEHTLDEAGWVADVGEVMAGSVAAGERSYSALLTRLHETEARLRGSDLWCVQVGGIEHLVADRLTSLPDLKVVHTVRDPRDRLSMSQGVPLPGRRGWDLGRWERSLRVGLECRMSFPDRYLLLTWEELVGRPEAAAARLAEFVGCVLDTSAAQRPSADKRSARGGIDGPHTVAAVRHLLIEMGYPVDRTARVSTSDLFELATFSLSRRSFSSSRRRGFDRHPAVAR